MKNRNPYIMLLLILVLVIAGLTWYQFQTGRSVHPEIGKSVTGEYSGSESCRQCHENFYRLWAPSHHGLAMQPFTKELFQEQLTPQGDSLAVGNFEFQVEFEGERGWVQERGLDGNKNYPIAHALGGKNVYYFLTPMDRGRLQVLPLAYDVHKKSWFDTAASGIRHFRDLEESPVGWKDPEYTFNTSCYGCHVSQFSRNYDLKTDTYDSTWGEPGINCEACHGSAVEHVQVCLEAADGETPKDLKIDVIRPPKYTMKISSDACASCHAKASPLTESFKPGDVFFDHFDLGTLELPDYYPDGRDLGENYTYTQWLMSPCAQSGEMDCLYCHTSSGRFRFSDDAPNNACMPCHSDKVEHVSEHSRHQEESAASQCISCHMPKTEFARMKRSDHSMLPPTPSATIAFGSPNACNNCHEDRNAAWADRWVREWRETDYQAPVLHRASLIEAARKRDWDHLGEMLEYLEDKNREEVFAASLIRLIRPCNDDRKWSVLIRALEDPSPLVRASAAESLGDRLDGEAFEALKIAVKDGSRLVRIRAAGSLGAVPGDLMDADTAEAFESAAEELKATLQARPDHWASYYNLGSFYFSRRDYTQAVSFYETAIRLQPNVIMPYVNISFAYNALGMNDKAEQSLRKACEITPKSLEANLNLGLLLGEMGRLEEADAFLRTAAELDPSSPVAAYNLGIITAQSGPLKTAIEYLRRAWTLQPENAQYGYSLAFYLKQSGNVSDSVRVLERIIQSNKSHIDAIYLLGEIYLQEGRTEKTRELYQSALVSRGLTPEESDLLKSRLEALPKD